MPKKNKPKKTKSSPEKMEEIPPISLWKNPCLSSKYLLMMLGELLVSILGFVKRRFILLSSIAIALAAYLYAPGPHSEVRKNEYSFEI